MFEWKREDEEFEWSKGKFENIYKTENQIKKKKYWEEFDPGPSTQVIQVS